MNPPNLLVIFITIDKNLKIIIIIFYIIIILFYFFFSLYYQYLFIYYLTIFLFTLTFRFIFLQDVPIK